MRYLLYLPFFALLWPSTPVLAELRCAGSQGTLTEESLPPGIAAKPARTTTTTGTRRALVLFARFKGEPANPLPAWAGDLFDPDLPGSVAHFYDTMSFGRLQVRGEVGPRVYESDREAGFYQAQADTALGGFGQFALEILRQADQDLDFSQYDNDGPDGMPNSGDDDGVVDAVFLVLQSMPRNFLIGGATGVGSLGFEQSLVSQDRGANGALIRVSPEQGTLQQGRSFAEAVGAMCHEYGHVLGLPDLYDTEFLTTKDAGPEEDSAGVGAWCLMGWGASGWNGNDGPNSFCAWSRMELGWAEVKEITRPQKAISLAEVSRGGGIFKLPLTNAEYFLLEHRRRSGNYYDRNIPGEGLLIWHVTYTLGASGHSFRTWVDLECADGRWRDAGYPLGQQPDSREGEDNLDFWAHDADYARQYAGNLGDATDPFDGVRFSAFAPGTNPDSYSNDGRRSVRITNIRLEGDMAFAQVQTEPVFIAVEGVELRDQNRDNIAVAGEEVQLAFKLANRGGVRATGLKAVLSSADSLVEILRAEAAFRDLAVDQQTLGRPLGGEFPRLRLKEGFSGVHQATVVLEAYAGESLAGLHAFNLAAVSPRQILRDLAVIDTLGNGDGLAQGGEFVRLGLALEAAPAELLAALDFSLYALDPRVRALGSAQVDFRPGKTALAHSDRTPEFLLPAALGPGTRLPFELRVRSEFGAWQDTLWVEIHAGGDQTPPRVVFPVVWYQEQDLVVSMPAHLIWEGSQIRSVTALTYTAADSAEVAVLPMEQREESYQVLWRGATPGEYLLAVEVEDTAGNRGRSALRRLYVRLPVAAWPGTQVPILGKGRATAVAYSSDGQLLAVASSAGVWLFDATTLAELSLLEGHRSQVRSVAFSPDGRLLASGGGYNDPTVRLWDLEARRLAGILSGHSGSVEALAFSPDGRVLASGGDYTDPAVRLWDVAQRQEVRTLRGHVQSVAAVAFSPDGETLASGGWDKTVRLWDVVQGQEERILLHQSPVMSVAFSPDGRWLASGSQGEVHLWDPSQGQQKWESPAGVVNSVAFSPDGQRLVTGGTLLSLWDVDQGQRLAFLEVEGRTANTTTALSPDGQVLALIGDETLSLLDLESRQEFASLGGFTENVWSMALSPDGQVLATGTYDAVIHLWDMALRKERGVLIHVRGRGHFPGVNALTFSPDGRVLFSGGGDGTVRVWDLEKQQEIGVLRGHTGEVFAVALGADGRTLASGGADSTVRLWDVVDQRQIGLMKERVRQVNAVAFSPDGRWLVSGGGGRTVQIWDMGEMAEAFVLEKEGGTSTLSFSPDGRTLAAGGGATVYLWDLGARRQRGALEGHGYDVGGLSFSPDGWLLAVGDGEGAVRVWDWERGQAVARLEKHRDPVASVLFSPDGQLLASGSMDGTVRLWQTAVLTAVAEENQARPAYFSLSPAYPNPFNPTTTLRFSLPQAGEAELSIYNLLGQRVATLVHGVQEAGSYVLQWNGRDDQGRALASGVYFYRLQAGGQVETRKLLLLR